jgi:DNA-binding NtrC family response regulator
MKILVMDDNRKDNDRLKKWLEEEGSQVEVCNSGQDGDAALAERGSSFIVAFVSWDMRGAYNGQELMARHRRNLPELKIVVMSHELAFNVAATARGLGANELLSKPLDRDRVTACFKSLSAPPKMGAVYIDKLRETIKGESQSLMRMLEDVARAIAATHLGVLIIGETGTGKELIARSIHQHSPRARRLFVPINCGALPEPLLEAELFGYVRGAFTGAVADRKGLWEEAEEGTLFLDEIGDTSQAMQVKLLRALQEKEIRRVGSAHAIPANARVVAATNKDLVTAVNKGVFREDLYYRLAQLIIRVPPLRERQGDVPILSRQFLDSCRGERDIYFGSETSAILNDYPYPGNIRQLENIISAAVAKLDEREKEIRPQHLPVEDMVELLKRLLTPEEAVAAAPATSPSEEHAEFDGGQAFFPEAWLKLPIHEAKEKVVRAFNFIYFKSLLEKHHYVKARVAHEAGIDRKTLNQHLEKAGLPTKKSKRSPPGDMEE